MTAEEEKEASVFARHLLIPESLILVDTQNIKFDIDGLEIRKLAARYKVPELLMTLRLVELGCFK